MMDDVKVATHEKEWKCTNTLACLNLGTNTHSDTQQHSQWLLTCVVLSAHVHAGHVNYIADITDVLHVHK